MKDFIQLVYSSAQLKDMVRPLFSAPAKPDILDKYVRLAYDLHKVFGTLATIRVSKGDQNYDALLLWHPTAHNVIVISNYNFLTGEWDEASLFRNGSIVLRKATDGELERYCAQPSVQPEHEGYMLRLLSLGVYQEQPEGDQQDMLPLWE